MACLDVVRKYGAIVTGNWFFEQTFQEHVIDLKRRLAMSLRRDRTLFDACTFFLDW